MESWFNPSLPNHISHLMTSNINPTNKFDICNLTLRELRKLTGKKIRGKRSKERKRLGVPLIRIPQAFNCNNGIQTPIIVLINDSSRNLTGTVSFSAGGSLNRKIGSQFIISLSPGQRERILVPQGANTVQFTMGKRTFFEFLNGERLISLTKVLEKERG